jgi:hypothetical protein
MGGFKMDLKQVQEEFQKSWINIKSLLDQQQDEMRVQSEVLTDLIKAQREQETVIRQLIDERF